jgi:8-oxo-dGTP pyrophosphatase MutT (NUDIX family)
MTPRNKPTLAAAVILLRQAVPLGFEVFLAQRSEGTPFLGGKCCFPGGAVSKEDFIAPMIEHCHGVTPTEAQSILGAHFSPSESLGVWVAAVRELFEEAGVLLAVEQSGAPLNLALERAERLAQRRRALLNQMLNFRQLIESESLLCDLASLRYFSSWQTPSSEPIRFDTRFFVAALPPGQAPLEASHEVAHSVWITPDRAIELFDRGELPLTFPTFAALRTLADFETLESVIREYSRGR